MALGTQRDSDRARRASGGVEADAPEGPAVGRADAPASAEAVTQGAPASAGAITQGAPASAEAVVHGAPASAEAVVHGAPASDGALRVGVRKTYKMFVGGAFVRSESGRTTQVRDHGDGAGERVAENIPRASRKDGRDAVVAASGAFGGWSSRPAYNRGQILYRLAEMLEARRAELVHSLQRGGLDAGAAEREALAAIDRAVAYAGWTDKYQSLFSSLNPVSGPHFTFTVPEPMGVVVIAAPPRPALLGLAGAVLPVITAGNTCVVLASEADPRTALVFGEALATSDLPGGVVNVLTGQRAEVLPHLAAHREVAALDLHNVDPALEKRLEEAAAESVKRVRARALAEAAWFDDRATESPRWIERFVEMKTIWHPAGP